MSIIARHLTIDMYKCKANAFADIESVLDNLKGLLTKANVTVLASNSQIMPDGHIAVILLFQQGHMTVHVFSELNYVAADAFICEDDAAPERFFTAMRTLFKPEKTKTTILKRGDFGTISDMKPKTKTKTSHIRKIKNTGNKVIKILSKNK